MGGEISEAADTDGERKQAELSPFFGKAPVSFITFLIHA